MFHSGGWGAYLSYNEKKDQPQLSCGLTAAGVELCPALPAQDFGAAGHYFYHNRPEFNYITQFS